MAEVRHAILVGINNYSDKPLSYCVKDAKTIGINLIEKCGFEKKNIKVLFSTSEKSNLITFNILQNKVKEISENFNPVDDTILFYFSGHGILDNEFKLDFKDEKVELNRIFELLKELSPKHLIMIIDACHSGFLFELKDGGELSIEEYFKERYKPDIKGFYFLAACDESETAKAYKSDELSKYTKALIDAINTERFYESGKITLESVHSYASIKLKEDKIQTPHIQINSGGYIISDIKSHKKVEKVQPKQKTIGKIIPKPAQEYFEEALELINNVKAQLKTFDGIIRGYIFKDFTRKDIYINPNDYQNSMSEAIANGIIDGDEDGVELNTSHKNVAPLFENLNKLEDLYAKISDPSEFMELFEEEFETDEFDLSNKEFWEAIFKTKIFFN